MMNFSIIIDSNEKKYKHIQDRLDMLGISYEKRKLDYGDYSFCYNGVSFEDKFVVERKANINEIVGNLTKGKRRFANEFKRAKGSKMIIMIESDESDIDNRNYRSSIAPAEIKKRLKTWANHFQLSIVYVEKKLAGDFIINQFNDYLLNYNEINGG